MQGIIRLSAILHALSEEFSSETEEDCLKFCVNNVTYPVSKDIALANISLYVGTENETIVERNYTFENGKAILVRKGD